MASLFVSLHIFAQRAAAQSIEEYSSAMTRIGCGAEFSRAASLPVPTHGYSEQAERRIGPTAEMRTRATGVVAADLRSSEYVRQRLLLAPVNSVDRMTRLEAISAFASYLYTRDAEGSGDAAAFEKGVAGFMLCLLEKRKGLKPEPPTLQGKLEKLNDPECGAIVGRLLGHFKPPPHPSHDVIMKSILEQQNGGSKERKPLEYARPTDRFEITSFAAPNSFAEAMQASLRFSQGIAELNARKAEDLGLVPSKEKLDSWNNAHWQMQTAYEWSSYWVCRRASREKLFEWMKQGDNNHIYYPVVGPTLGSPKSGPGEWRLIKARLQSVDGDIKFAWQVVHTCQWRKRMSQKDDSSLPACNARHMGADIQEPSPELRAVLNTIGVAVNSKSAVLVGNGSNPAWNPW